MTWEWLIYGVLIYGAVSMVLMCLWIVSGWPGKTDE